MLSIHSIHHLAHPVMQTQFYRTMRVHPIHWMLCHTIRWYICFGSPNIVWFLLELVPKKQKIVSAYCSPHHMRFSIFSGSVLLLTLDLARYCFDFAPIVRNGPLTHNLYLYSAVLRWSNILHTIHTYSPIILYLNSEARAMLGPTWSKHKNLYRFYPDRIISQFRTFFFQLAINRKI